MGWRWLPASCCLFLGCQLEHNLVRSNAALPYRGIKIIKGWIAEKIRPALGVRRDTQNGVDLYPSILAAALDVFRRASVVEPLAYLGHRMGGGTYPRLGFNQVEGGRPGALGGYDFNDIAVFSV